MKHRRRRNAQSVDLRAAGMTLAQISRSTGRPSNPRTALIIASVALFGVAAAAGSYIAFGQAGVSRGAVAALGPEGTPPNTASATRADASATASPQQVAPPPAPAPAASPVASPIAAPQPTAAPQPAPAAPVVAAVPEVVAPVVAAVPNVEAPPNTVDPASPAPASVAAAPPPTAEVAVAEDTTAEADCVAALDAEAASIRVPFGPYAVEAARRDLGPVLDLAQRVADCDAAYIVVAGHADPSGDETGNLLLSWQRAEFVITQLTDAGFDRDRLEAIGFGSRRPISEGAAGADDSLNRRVDFVVRADLP